MNIVLQDEQGRAVGHIHLNKEGSALYLRGNRTGEGVLVSKTGERCNLDTPCPFSPVGAVVVEGERILYRGLASNGTLSLRELEILYRHPPVKEEETAEPEPALELEQVEPIEPQPPTLSPIEEAQAAAAVFARVAQEAGQVFSELEGNVSPAQTAPKGGEKWMEDTEALLSGATKKPPSRSEAVNPFPHAFPGARLQRVRGRGVLEYLEGEWQQGNRRYRLVAVPGAPALRPPRHLQGFTRYISTGQGGYWVKLSPLF